MKTLLSLNPIRALHDYWSQSSPEAHLAVGGSGFAGWVAHVDWAAVLAFGGLAAMTIGGTAMQLWKQWQFVKLEVAERKRKLEERVAGSVVLVQPSMAVEKLQAGVVPPPLQTV